MRRTALFGLCLGIAALALSFPLHYPNTSPDAHLIPPLDRRPAKPAGLYQGVASCAIGACHGGRQVDGLGSEATIWAIDDPHALAYAVLLEERSQRIQTNLNAGASDLRPQDNRLCLDCHVQPGIQSSSKSAGFSLQDGVGCESCHGGAASWLHAHSRQSLDAIAKQELGMIDMTNLRVRAEVCVACHVGTVSADVNHDLIAAGHPRLRFEFTSLLASYPRHWRKEVDYKHYPDLEARAWAIGRVVSAKAALQLLASRAANTAKIWPEFAEYDCYGCHHELGRSTSSGKLTPNVWYYAACPDLDVTDLYCRMTTHIHDRSRIAEIASRMAESLQSKPKFMESQPVNSQRWQVLMMSIASDDGFTNRNSWDGDTQRFLGAAALTASHRQETPPEVQRTVTEIGAMLRAALDTNTATLDSPRNYDPATLRQHWRVLKTQLDTFQGRQKNQH